MMQCKEDGKTITVPVPNHAELRIGTLQSIIRQSGIPRKNLGFKPIIKNELPSGTLLNVNIPLIPRDKIKGVKITNQFSGDFDEYYDRRTDPRGRDDVIWNTLTPPKCFGGQA